MKRTIQTDRAPAAIGPYSQAIQSGGFVFCSGQIGMDPVTGALVPGGVEAETRRALENLRAVLEAAGTGLGSVVKTTVYLRDMGDFGSVNEVYAEFFASKPPARATIQVAALPKGAAVEIEAVAREGEAPPLAGAELAP